MITFLHLKGYSARQIHTEMFVVYGRYSPSYGTIVRWKRNFQTSHMSVTDDPRSGRTSLTEDAAAVKKLGDFILLDRRVTIKMIINETHTLVTSVWKLFMKKCTCHKSRHAVSSDCLLLLKSKLDATCQGKC